MSTIKYKDYQASVEYEDGAFFVKVLHIDDLLIAQFDKASDAEKVMRELVDEYVADCEARGQQPSKPFKGSFNVRLSPDLHRRVAMTAVDENQSLNAWISVAISEKLECTRFSDRLHGVIAAKQFLSVWGKQRRVREEFSNVRRPVPFAHISADYASAVKALAKDKSRHLNG